MIRYRPPQPKSSAYITKPGYVTLGQELIDLWVTRREVTVALSAAAAEGDRSENAEYIYRKKQLREVDRRIRYLQKRLDELIVVEQLPDNPLQVFFGAWVELEDEDGQRVIYRIVGPDEFSVEKKLDQYGLAGRPGTDAKKLDDEVIVQCPAGQMRYVITGIRYTEDDY